jgi:ABC-type uncharacterized transport system substrate-binding protein
VSLPARVGLLWSGRADDVERAFLELLRVLGWTERQNLVIEIRRAEGDAAALRGLATELVERRVHVIVTSGTTAIQAARQVTDRGSDRHGRRG